MGILGTVRTHNNLSVYLLDIHSVIRVFPSLLHKAGVGHRESSDNSVQDNDGRNGHPYLLDSVLRRCPDRQSPPSRQRTRYLTLSIISQLGMCASAIIACVFIFLHFNMLNAILFFFLFSGTSFGFYMGGREIKFRDFFKWLVMPFQILIYLDVLWRLVLFFFLCFFMGFLVYAVFFASEVEEFIEDVFADC